MEMVEESRKALQMTRQQMAEKMGNGVTKEKLDVTVRRARQGVLPRADFLQAMVNAVGLVGYDASLYGWGNPKKEIDD